MAVSDYSTTASSNITISGTNIAENCPAGGINNAIRQMMADVRSICTDAVLSVMSKATVAEIRTALDALEAKDATEAINALAPAADRLAYYTGTNTAALATLTSFARTLLDDADAATARSTLAAQGLTSSNLIENGGYRVWDNGLKETWGKLTVGANTSGVYTVPVAHSSWIVPSFGATVQFGDASQQENIGLTSVGLGSLTFYNAENFSRTVYIHTKGV